MADHIPVFPRSARASIVTSRHSGEWTAPSPTTSHLVTSPESSPIVRGRAAVIAMRPLLVELARRTGQGGALDCVDLLVKSPNALRKIPCLVLVGLPEAMPPEEATAAHVQGAVLLYEYSAAGIPTGIFATDDISGERTVLAPPERRAEIAERACRMLAADGAAVSLVSVEGALLPTVQLALAPPHPESICHLATRVRSQRRDLLLRETLEATMALFGRNTRRNFRRYRERLERDLGVSFVPWVQIDPDAFLDLYRGSTNPVTEEEAAWRYHFVYSSPNRLFAGMRAADGRWLSLIAGTRYRDHTHIEWQVNRGDLPSYSLSTVMRSYLLEHEVAVGTRRLLFKGGTPHSMGLSLMPAETLDILVVRRGARGWLLRRFARWVFPSSNFLRRLLEDPTLKWSA